MIAKVKSWFTWLWTHHIQKTMAALIGGFTVADVLGAAGPIKSLFGDKALQVAVLVAAVVVYVKAHTVKQSYAAPLEIPPYRPEPPPS